MKVCVAMAIFIIDSINELTTESGYGGIRFKILYKVGTPEPAEEEKKQLRRIHLDICIGVDSRQKKAIGARLWLLKLTYFYGAQ